MADLSQQAYCSFSELVNQRLGINLGANKQYLVKSRLSKLMREHNYNSLNTLISDITQGISRDLQEAALFAMTTNETYWFRDEYPFDILSQVMLPALTNTNKNLRIWSAACSTGQEPYSIAMTIFEYQRQNKHQFTNIEILATDISLPVLNIASEGIFDSLAMSRGLSQQRLTEHFTSKATSWHVNEDVKRLVTFKQLNLLDAFDAMGTFDVIFCRNVLIYFDNDTIARILQKFSALLPQERYLFLGAAESASVSAHLFQMVKQQRGLFYKRL